MKKNALVLVSIIFLVAASFLSCDKSEATVKTKTELITQSPWKFDKATAFGLDVSSQIPACMKDNIITLNTNGTGTIDESTSVCTPSTAGSLTWSFQNNEGTLNLSAPLFPGGTGAFTIVTLNETNLAISQDMVIPPSTTAVTVTVTFKH